MSGVHQFVPALIPRDATGSHTLLLRQALRAAGWRSDIYAEATHDELAGEATYYERYRAEPGDVLVYQLSTSSAVGEYLLDRPEPLVLDYHNITRPELTEAWDPEPARRSAEALDQLARLAPRAALGLAVSAYNQADLVAAGCRRTAVVGVLVDLGRLAGPPDPAAAARLEAARRGGGADWLFVGRVVPSKGQHDLVKALWAYRRLYDRRARLHLVGSTPTAGYLAALGAYAADLGLDGAVMMAGDVSDAVLAAHYSAADVFVSASRHEGFGVPLLEAMRMGVPVVALGAAAVPETVGRAGLVVDRPDAVRLAAAVDRVLSDGPLRHRLVARGRQRAGHHALEANARRTVDAIASVVGVRAVRLAFVTPRYGPAVMGGAETAARQLAEHLVAQAGFDVEVFSTCALDHLSWDNVLAPGDSELNGVTVHRYPVAAGRHRAFYPLDARLRSAPSSATRGEAEQWVRLNGPVAPALVDAVCRSGVDLVAFYPYLHYPTVWSIGRVPMPAVLHPAAHDEPALYLRAYRATFAAADAICYHTVSERHLVQRVHPVAGTPQMVLGLGVGAVSSGGRRGADVLGLGHRPYVVSVGRVDDHKGSSMLAAFFRQYKRRRPGPLALAMVGPVSARIPEDPDVVLTGTVPEADKWDIVRDAAVSVSPSALESFSLVVTEAWEAGVPVVVNARCGPTTEHCQRSGGGAWFGSYVQFEAVLDRLLADPGLRGRMAERGRAYVDRHFQWPVLVERYARFAEAVVGRGRAPGRPYRGPGSPSPT